MHRSSARVLRVSALAAATLFALSATVATAAPPSAPRVHSGALESGTSFDRFIVKYREGTSESGNETALRNALNAASVRAGALVQAAILQRGGRPSGLPFQLAHVRRMSLGADVVKSSEKLDRAAAELLMRQIAMDTNVEYVEIDRLNRISLTPNDTNYSQQWGYFNATAGIKANEAWDITSGAGVVVAVLDTGITNHSDLNANILPGYDFIADSFVARDGNGRDADASDPGDWNNATECDQPGYDVPAANSSWHGTHVAGTVAAVTNNAKGVAGTAFGAKVVPVRVLGRCGGYDSDIADAMIWASGGSVSGVPANANPASVINLSLGGGGACGATTQAAINTAVGRGAVLAIAAGNDNTNVSNASPANCANVIAVGSITSTGARSSFSNYGSGVDIAAPGSTIMSTLNTGTQGPLAETYVNYSGTSMATPHVAGVIALMQSVASPAKTPAEIESIIKSTARAFPSTPSQPIGSGIVNAKAAVDAVRGQPPQTVLSKGVPVSNLAAATGSALVYTMVVPAGASNLTFTTSGGTGDSDMYVKLGSTPTDSVYDCRPYKTGNAETCTFATPTAGTYYVRLKAYTAFSGMSLVGNYSLSSGQTYSNTTDYAIKDNTTVDSPITVSGRSGNASSTSSVTVDIIHTYQGDLKVDLVAPDGSLYNIHNRTGSGTDNVKKTVTFNLSSELLNGTWKLRVNDNGAGDTGYINSWSITF